ncbi:MAG: transposase [Chloroflexi bacterium]|nr:transposase [Chloroflexota bacterium]
MAKRYSAEDKLAAVLAAIQGRTSIREICRRREVSVNMLYLWRKRFLEGGRLALATNSLAESRRVRRLLFENDELKRMLAEECLTNRLLKGGLGRPGRT